MSQIIITGDDFGVSHEVNEAIESQYLAGRLTQASLMIHGRHVEEAQRIARRNPGLGVGLHLTLCAASRAGRTALTDERGNFEPSPAAAGLRYFMKRALRATIRVEIEEQFQRFREAGFPPVYWDGHTHLHLHPVVLAETLPVAMAHDFRATRLMQTEKDGALGWVFNQLSSEARKKLAKAGISYANRTYGLSETGKLGDAAFTRLQRAAGQVALAEIYYHPGVDGPENGRFLPEARLTNWKEILQAPGSVDDAVVSG